MPLYEYFCEDCQQSFTLLQSTSVNKEETVCEKCGSRKVHPRLSTFASKIQRSKTGPVTVDDLPNKNILNLPPPRLRSEL